MLYFINYLKMFACMLITNFHMDIVYPENISILAIGGDIGNNIFFTISGFTLYTSLIKEKNVGLLNWYLKRCKKIIPYVLLFYFIDICCGTIKINTLGTFFYYIIFPTAYWFTGAILVLYIFLFVTIQILPKIDLKTIGLCVFVLGLYFIIGGIYAERYIVGFMAMVIGYYLRDYLENNKINQDNKLFGIVLLISSSAIYILIKLIIKNGKYDFELLHLIKDISTILLAVSLIIMGYICEKKISQFSCSHLKLYRIIKKISQLTLLIYLVQVAGKRWIIREISSVIAFPIDYMLSVVAIVILAAILDYIVNFIKKRGLLCKKQY